MHDRALPETAKVLMIKTLFLIVVMHDRANLRFVSASRDVLKTKILDFKSKRGIIDSVPKHPTPISPKSASTFSFIAPSTSLAL